MIRGVLNVLGKHRIVWNILRSNFIIQG